MRQPFQLFLYEAVEGVRHASHAYVLKFACNLDWRWGMAGKVVETIYGKRHKYEIRAADTCLMTKFVIYRDGSRWKGDYDSLSRAVEVAQSAG